MKRIFIISVSLFMGLWCFAQSTPEAFLAELPAVPSVKCGEVPSVQSERIQAFHTQIDGVKDKLKEALKKERLKNKNRQLSKSVKNKASELSGLSEDELEAVSDKNAKKSEKNKLIDKSVQSQTGFSMDEMQKLNTMSKADRQKWANENFGKVMQAQKNNPASTNLKPQNNNMVEQAKQQTEIAQDLQYHQQRLTDMETDLQAKAEDAKQILNAKLKEIKLQFEGVNDGEGGTKIDIEKLKQKRRLENEAKLNYCHTLSPLNTNYIETYKNTLLEHLLPDLKQLEDIEYKLMKQTYETAEMTCFSRLRAVEDYITVLYRAYNYYIPVEKAE